MAWAVSILNTIVIISGFGYVTSVVQKLTVLRLKDNIHISIGHFLIEVSIIAISVIYMIMNANDPTNEVIIDKCKPMLCLET